MKRTEEVELTVLCLIQKENKYLLQNRVKSDWRGFTMPGGHIEAGESIVDAVVREMKEETGLTLTSYQFRGIVTFLYNDNEAEYMCLYTASGFYGEMIPCNEGELKWVKKEEVLSLNLWEGDKVFLRLLGERDAFFSLKLVYEGEKLVRTLLDGQEYHE